MLICLDKKQEGPLGIHVLPYCDDVEQCEGLIIKEIVKGGRIDRDGRFAVGDRIIEINDQTLLNVNFATAQSLIGDALKDIDKDNQLRLNIVKNSHKKQQMNYTLLNDQNKLTQNIPNYYSNPQNLNERLIDHNDANLIKDKKDKVNDNKFNELNRTTQNQKLNEQSNYQNDEIFDELSPDDYVSDAFKRDALFNASNTRRMGKKYHIRLVKELNGLGFTITTRDNQVGQSPIYIKKIIPDGAAKKDGNLRGGDRLLEVNGIEMTGKTRDETLKILREIETGQTVDLIVSRQENNFDRTSTHSSFNKQIDKQIDKPQNEMNRTISKLPRQLPVDKIDSNQLDLAKTREVLSFNIPLNDTGSAGLGLSVKGKTSTSSTTKKTTDLGIFVKLVLHGGAAHKDGRLKPNDQLISINGISLLDSVNEEAMNTLRRVLKDNDGVSVSSNSINLVVARVIDPMENPNNSLLSNNSMAFGKNEIYDTYDTFGVNPIDNTIYNHQRDLSTISTDSIKLNFYEQNYQPLDQIDFMNQPQIKPLTTDDFSELYNLNRNANIFNGLTSKDSCLSTDSNDQFTISTPVKTSIKSDFTGNQNLNEMSINKFMNNSNRTDVLIENDDQENNDPNVSYRINNAHYFNQNQQTNNEQLDDSLNKSKDSEIMNLSNATNQLSLNDEDEIGFNFQRDGFGRQSMSEKRLHAQLDAKNAADSFKQTKQRKSQKNQQLENENSTTSKSQNNQMINKSLPNSDPNTLVKSLNNYDDSNERQSKQASRFTATCCCFNEPQTYSQSTCPYHSSSQQTSPKTDQTISSTNQDDFYSSFASTALKTSNVVPVEQSSLHFNHQQPTPFTLAAHLANQQTNQLNKLNYLNQPNFLSRQPINHTNYLTNLPTNYGMTNAALNSYEKQQGNRINNNNSFGQWLGMKKSSSLESLQTMMHEIKKETINYNTNQPYNTMRRPNKVSRNRNTNESFRTAIDKSYEEYLDNLPMETVNEEFGEIGGFSTLNSKQLINENGIKNQNTRVPNNQSKQPSSSQLSNGANEISDDEIGLIRRRSSTGSSKMKKAVGSGILRTLFRFGSKKFKDKDKQQVTKLSTPQNIKKELEEEVEKIRARKAALYEQEIIQEYYKRLIDQQKFQQIVSQQRQQILNSQSTSANSTLSNTLKKKSINRQSIQQQQMNKQQDQNIYLVENANQNLPSYLNLQSNYTHQSNHPQTKSSNLHSNSNQMIINKQISSYDTNYLQQNGYGVQNRPNLGFENNSIENHRPKSSYLSSGYDNNIFANSNIKQNGFQNGGHHLINNHHYTQDLNRRPYMNSHLNAKQYPGYYKDTSIQQFETVHNRVDNYDLKDAMQRPRSRVAIDLNEDLNHYVITVQNSNLNKASRPYV